MDSKPIQIVRSVLEWYYVGKEKEEQGGRSSDQNFSLNTPPVAHLSTTEAVVPGTTVSYLSPIYFLL